MPIKIDTVGWKNYLFLCICLFIFLTGKKKVNPELNNPSINHLKGEKTKY